MKRQMIIITLVLVLALSLAEAGLAIEPPALMERGGPRSQAACPVVGGKINKDLYVDYQGQRIYFCCPSCIPIFQKDPEGYLRKMRQQGVIPEKSPSGK